MQLHTFPLIDVAGDAYTMGREHGEQARELVQQYLLWIDRLTGLSRDVLCANAIRFLPAMAIQVMSPTAARLVTPAKVSAAASESDAVVKVRSAPAPSENTTANPTPAHSRGSS